MNQCVLLLLICALQAALNSLATCDKPIDDSYIDWSVLDDELKNEIGYCEPMEVTKAVLEKIEGSDTEVICANIDALDKTTTSRSERRVCSDLLNFTDTKREMNVRTIFLMLQITLFMRDEPDKFSRFAQFLKFFGRDKFGQASMSHTFPYSTTSENAEQTLNKFFAALVGLKPSSNLSEGKLLKKVSSLDLASSKLKIHKALEVAGVSDISLGKFFDYLNEVCRDFQRHHNNAFNIFAFADAFGFKGRVDSDRILKLKEYNRLCLSLLRPDRVEAIESNVIDALARSS